VEQDEQSGAVVPEFAAELLQSLHELVSDLRGSRDSSKACGCGSGGGGGGGGGSGGGGEGGSSGGSGEGGSSGGNRGGAGCGGSGSGGGDFDFGQRVQSLQDMVQQAAAAVAAVGRGLSCEL
jgi:hypothetical protein